MTLVEFLLARIAEDEAVAVATRGNWNALPWKASDRGIAGPVDGPFGHAAVVIDPARVLAECEAKRRIVELHPSVIDDGQTVCSEEQAEWPCPTLRLLALPYADHPDYRDEWRP